MSIEKRDYYMCDNNHPHWFPPTEYISTSNICPECGRKMKYWYSCDIDTNTNKVVNRYTRTSTKDIDIKEIMTGIPSIECPYCHSKDTKKISTTSKAINTAIFGFLGTKRYKQWHCNKCGSDF